MRGVEGGSGGKLSKCSLGDEGFVMDVRKAFVDHVNQSNGGVLVVCLLVKVIR